MKIAILTFDGFNELDSFIALGLLNRLKPLGWKADMPACTDLTTKPWVIEAGVRVVDAPFHARGPIATAGGCLASQYLAAWMMASRAGIDATTNALLYAAPVGEKEAYVERLLKVVRPFVIEPEVP